MGRKNLNTPPPGYKYNEASIRRGRGGRITKIMPTITPTSSINNHPYDINATNVSILIPAFNCVDFIEGCLDSIKNQTKEAHRILVGVDGCNKTLKKLKSISHKYCNLEIFYSSINSGPYKVMNSLISKIPNEEYFIFFGADDTMYPHLIETMAVDNLPKVSKHDGILFIQKGVFCEKIGGYRPWRCAGDTDALFRLRIATGRVRRIPVLFNRGIHENQLTKTTKLNNLRQHYIGIIEENEKKENPDIFIKPEFANLSEVNINNPKVISVNLATYPGRINSFITCITPLLNYKTINKIRVYLNEFEKIPKQFPIDPKIEYVMNVPNIKDSGKFHWVHRNNNEYYFTVDDDILYPEDYFKEHIKLLKKYNNEAFITLHGKRLPSLPKNFHDVLKPMYHCLKQTTFDVKVNIGGTGVMVFDNSKIKIPNNLFQTHGMCDLWIAKYAQQKNIPIICRAHEKNHILPIDILNKDTLFEKRHLMWNDQIKILQSIPWNQLKNKKI